MRLGPPREFSAITAKHRYVAARALENLEDWYRVAERCVAVTVEPGKCGKFPGVRRVWVTVGEADRARRGLRVPDFMTPAQYRKLIHQYIKYLVERRVGSSDYVVKPL